MTIFPLKNCTVRKVGRVRGSIFFDTAGKMKTKKKKMSWNLRKNESHSER